MNVKETLRLLCEISSTYSLEDFVYLYKDDQGYYVKYALIPGFPKNNRCLSKYTKYCECNKIYYLDNFTCSGNSGCRVGKPKLGCLHPDENWTVENPGKCACYYLNKIDMLCPTIYLKQ